MSGRKEGRRKGGVELRREGNQRGGEEHLSLQHSHALIPFPFPLTSQGLPDGLPLLRMKFQNCAEIWVDLGATLPVVSPDLDNPFSSL